MIILKDKIIAEKLVLDDRIEASMSITQYGTSLSYSPEGAFGIAIFSGTFSVFHFKMWHNLR